MKVLYISNSDDKYGSSKSLLDMVVKLKSNYNVSPIILTPIYNDINRKCEELHIENYYLRYYSFMYANSRKLTLNTIKGLLKAIVYKPLNKITVYRLNRKIDFTKVDLIHSNISVIDVGANISKEYRIPHVWHLREFGQEDFKLKSLKHDYIKFMNEHTDIFISISKAVKTTWIRKGIEKNKVKVIYNGINEKKFFSPNSEKKQDASLKIVFSGALTEHKGQHQLIEALNLIPLKIKENIFIDFIGAGDSMYENKLKDKVSEYGLSKNVNFLGYQNNIEELLPNYEVGIVCSKSEGFGRVTVEYMMNGLCVIASDTGANTELIDDGINGYIYKYGDYQNLASKIEYVYINREIINIIGNNAITKSLDEYTSDLNAKNIYKTYVDIVKD